MTDLVSIVETTYRVDLPLKAWLREVADAVRPVLDRGFGVCAGTYLVRPDGIDFKLLSNRGMPLPGWMKVARITGRRLGAENLKRTFMAHMFGNMRTMVPTYDELLLARFVRAFGVDNGVGVNALDPSGHGVFVGAPVAATARDLEGARDRWSRIAVHLGTAFRLRRRLTQNANAEQILDLFSGADAIMDPGGRLLHAEAPAQPAEARAMLRGAATAVDRARARLRREAPDEALAEWRAMVEARWTIVDHFDRDGRRYVVARKNRPVAHAIGALTLRERQVLGFAALGRSNKLIAYELGLSESAVGTHVSNVLQKLGLRSRVELVQRFTDAFLANAAAAE